MQYTIIPAAQRQPGTWPGGTTEQLYIWPESALYARRDFDFRVSTAKVELAESDFTPLPGITRWIMPLSGQMQLNHVGHGEATLAPMQVHCFEGGWRTKSFGQCTDFNLMLRESWQGDIWAGPEEYICPEGGFAGVYAFDGPVTVTAGAGAEAQRISLAHRDLLVLSGSARLRIDGGRAVGFGAWGPQIHQIQ